MFGARSKHSDYIHCYKPVMCFSHLMRLESWLNPRCARWTDRTLDISKVKCINKVFTENKTSELSTQKNKTPIWAAIIKNWEIKEVEFIYNITRDFPIKERPIAWVCHNTSTNLLIPRTQLGIYITHGAELGYITRELELTTHEFVRSISGMALNLNLPYIVPGELRKMAAN